MAGYNFSKPVVGDTYTDILPELRDATDSLAKMLDGTSDSNVPTDAIRINSGQGYRLEKYDGSSWNAITAKLGNLNSGLEDLTSGEITQLKNIDSVTISNTQWGYLGGLSSAPLEDNDLAANGGSVPEVDRSNIFTRRQILSRQGDGEAWTRDSTDDTGMHIVKGRDSANNELFRIGIDGLDGAGAGYAQFRSADYYEFLDGGLVVGSGASSQGAGTITTEGNITTDGTVVGEKGLFGGGVTENQLSIRYNSGPDEIIIERFGTGTQDLRILSNGDVKFATSGGWYTPNATDGSKGADTINASGFYENGTLMSLAANGGSVPEEDRSNTFTASQTVQGGHVQLQTTNGGSERARLEIQDSTGSLAIAADGGSNLSSSEIRFYIDRDPFVTSGEVGKWASDGGLVVGGSGASSFGAGTAAFENSGFIGSTVSDTGGSQPGLFISRDSASAGSAIGQIRGQWNGNDIAGIFFRAGDDTTNKDEGDLMMGTWNAGTFSEVMRLHQEGTVQFSSFGAGVTSNKVVASFDNNIEFNGVGTSRPVIRIQDITDLRIYDGADHTTFHSGGGVTIGNATQQGAGTLAVEDGFHGPAGRINMTLDNIIIENEAGNEIQFDIDGADSLRIASDLGVYMPGANGGSQGADTINAGNLLINGNDCLHTGYSGSFSATSADVDFNSIKANGNLLFDGKKTFYQLFILPESKTISSGATARGSGQIFGFSPRITVPAGEKLYLRYVSWATFQANPDVPITIGENTLTGFDDANFSSYSFAGSSQEGENSPDHVLYDNSGGGSSVTGDLYNFYNPNNPSSNFTVSAGSTFDMILEVAP